MSYELVVGLETHVELFTRSKIFCSCSTAFGAPPNTQCCPVCLGLPGALPRLNRQAVFHALRAGLALHCDINSISKFDRKNYNYPDLPKGYQITQQRLPLCQNGYLDLDDGTRISILQIHLEEDAGKLLHRKNGSCVDFNRAGIPLIEIVTAPCFSSAEQAGQYLNKLRLLMKYLEISDCRMQEGSLRCDVNVSVRSQFQRMGKRVEIKNLNSISFVEKAIAYEFSRQVSLLEAGEFVLPETRRFDEASGSTKRMRGKEKMQDYRYFPDPDLPNLQLSSEEIDIFLKQMPELPEQKRIRYSTQLGLSSEFIRLLVQYPKAALYFEEAAVGLADPQNAAHLILGPIFSYLSTETEKDAFEPPISSKELQSLLKLQETERLSSSFIKTVINKMLSDRLSLNDCLKQFDYTPLSAESLVSFCQQAISQNPKALSDYLSGKQKALQVLIGFVMKQSNGRAQPQVTAELLQTMIRQSYPAH